MKKRLIPCFLLLLHAYCFSQQRYEDYKFSSLGDKPVGNIQSVIEQIFVFKATDTLNPEPGNMVLQRMVKLEAGKDKRTLSNFYYNVKDTTNYYTRSIDRFDSLGNHTGFESSGLVNISVNIKLKYDASQHIIEEKSYSTTSAYKDSLRNREVRKYDRKGNLLEDASYSADKNWGLDIRHVYTYDDNNNCLSTTVYSDTNSRTYQQAICEEGAQKYKTIEKGYIEKKIMEYENNRLVHTFTINRYGCIGYNRKKMEYDNNGDKIKVLSYNPQGEVTDQWFGKYIDHRLVLETGVHGMGAGALTDSCRWNYDSSGNLIERVKYTSTGKPYNIIKYTYDNSHNWITRLETVFNKPKEFVRRRITYYNL